MKERINDKIGQIRGFLEFIEGRIPSTIEKYKIDLDKKAICERYAEKIIEALLDLAFLIAKDINIKIPTEDKDIFDALSENKIISAELAEKLQDAKGMRNIIIHEYGDIDDEIVYEALSSELLTDAVKFINAVEDSLEEIEQ